jgi:type II secretory pathway pseudopilin PulG
LIEILIVVAIIGILSSIAVSDFLEAQVRAKVARALSDMRAIATGLEMYAVDHNDYPPNDGRYNVTPAELTTPIAYLSNRVILDPFAEKIDHPFWGREARLYTYARVAKVPWETPPPPIEGIDHPFFNPGAERKYGKWYQLSIGPDLLYSGKDQGLGEWPTFLFDTPYDPSNGTVSFGNILRTHKESIVTETLTP